MAVLRSDQLGTLYAQVWLIGFLVNILVSTVFARSSARSEASLPTSYTTPTPEPQVQTMPVTPAPIPLLDRLPAGFGVPIAIKSEDHYVRVFAQGRDTLILLRLRDAIAELGATQGMQVHRSWWVARDGIV